MEVRCWKIEGNGTWYDQNAETVKKETSNVSRSRIVRIVWKTVYVFK